MNCVLEVKFFCERCEIVGIGIHVIAIPGLSGTAVTAPVMRDDSIAPLSEKHHLCVPVVRSEGPSVTEHDWLTFSPIFVVNLRTVVRFDCRHGLLSLCV